MEYRIKRIELINHQDEKKFKQTDVVVSDLERFRKRIMGRKYKEVRFVYNTVL